MTSQCSFTFLTPGEEKIHYILYDILDSDSKNEDINKQKTLKVYKSNQESFTKQGIPHLLEIDTLFRLSHPNLIHAERLIDPKDCNLEDLAVVLPQTEGNLFTILKNSVSVYSRLDICFTILSAIDYLLSENLLYYGLNPNHIKININTNNTVLTNLNTLIKIDAKDSEISFDKNKLWLKFRPYEHLSNNKDNVLSEKSIVWQLGMFILFSIFEIIPEGSSEEEIKAYLEQYNDISVLLDNILSEYLLANIINGNNNINLSKQEDEDINSGDSEENLEENDIKQIYVSVIDLLKNMLMFNPNDRYSIKDILNHSCWRYIGEEITLDQNREVIQGNTLQVDSPVYVDCVRSLERLFDQNLSLPMLYYFGERMPSAVLYLATDLIYRSVYFIDRSNLKQYYIHNIACNFMAWKFYGGYLEEKPNLDEDENSFLKYSPLASYYDIGYEDVTKMEIFIITKLGGKIYRSYLYDFINDDQVVDVMNNVLFDSRRYYSVNNENYNTNGKKRNLKELINSRIIRL